MAETAEKLYEIELSVPLQNIVQGSKKEYFGKVRVTKEVADDLKRREYEHMQYERSLIRDNGHQIDAGSLVGNQGN